MLTGVEDIAICRLTGSDVVRHVMVQRIIKAYEDDENAKRKSGNVMNSREKHDTFTSPRMCPPGQTHKAPLIRKCIRTALAAEGVNVPCEIDVLLTNDEGIQEINREKRQVDQATDVLCFPMLELTPGDAPGRHREDEQDPETGLCPAGRHGHLRGPGQGPGGGVRPQRRAGAGLSGRPLRAAPAGL